jgi:hypothetical protein
MRKRVLGFDTLLRSSVVEVFFRLDAGKHGRTIVPPEKNLDSGGASLFIGGNQLMQL